MSNEGALKDVTKGMLEELYWEQKLSLPKIAELLGVTIRAIAVHMKKHSVPTRTISEAKKGYPFYDRTGIRASAKTRRKLSIAHRRNPARYWLGKHHSEDTRRKLSIIERGEGNPFFGKHHNEDTKAVISRKAKERWLDSEFVARTMQARQLKPNKIELAFDAILQELLPGEYKYVGDGQFILGGRCPDWLNVNGQKKLLELYGDYWHREEDPQEKIDHYKQYGFDTLVIWEHELEDKNALLQRINDFNKKEVHHGR